MAVVIVMIVVVFVMHKAKSMSLQEVIEQIENVLTTSNIEKETFVQALVAVLLKTDNNNIVEQTLKGEN